MKVITFVLGACLCVFVSCKSVTAVVAPISNQQASFPLSTEEEQEINIVIAKMSLAEKVGQTCQITLDVLLKTNSDGSARTIAEIDEEKLKVAIDKYKVGSVLNVGSHTLSLAEWEGVLKAVHRNYQQGLSKAPIIYGVDAIHGVNYTVGGTLFPQEIGLAATWNPLLAASFGEITAYELRASGIPWNFSPVLDLARQPLWSRTFETLGEDPYLASQMGAAIVTGYQGKGGIDAFHVAACMKHFVGYSATASGRDRTPAWIPQKYMTELYLPSFKKAVEAGALTVMINSGVVNGIPGHMNYDLITKTLKQDWGFQGFAVSDWEDFIMLHTVHRTAPTLSDAYIQSFNAGVDMSMVPLSPQYQEYCESMTEAVKAGKITMERLDDAVRRILRVKMKLDLFKHPIPTFSMYPDFGSTKFKIIAKQAATESITLLKNNQGTLPLNPKQKVMIAGPTADNLIFLNGAWTHTWQGVDKQYNTKGCLTIREVFEQKLGKENCLYAPGASLVLDENGFEKTVYTELKEYNSMLDKADVLVLCLGELPATEKPGDILSLNLDPQQRELAKLAYAKNKKVVLVLLEGRPRIIHDIVDSASAIIQCYLPGDYGAEALINLMYGEANFSGKLPYTYPKYDGVIEFYDHPRSVDRSKNGPFDAYDPEWDFGFGLSYSKVTYSKLTLNNSTMHKNDSLRVSVFIQNESNQKTDEVVQLYLSDQYASFVPTGKSLKRFEKVTLQANERKELVFYLYPEDLKFADHAGNDMLEQGDYTLTIGNQLLDFKFLLTN